MMRKEDSVQGDSKRMTKEKILLYVGVGILTTLLCMMIVGLVILSWMSIHCL